MDIHVIFLSNLHFFKLFFAKFLNFCLFIFSPASAFVPAAAAKKKAVAMQILAGLQPGKTYLCQNFLHAQATSVNVSRAMRKGTDYHM